MSNEKQLRDRRFWLFIPVLIVPIVTIFFWLMGGGTEFISAGQKKKGLNTQLPNARAPQDSVADKISFYTAAANDSAKRREQLRNDPYVNKRSQKVIYILRLRRFKIG